MSQVTECGYEYNPEIERSSIHYGWDLARCYDMFGVDDIPYRLLTELKITMWIG